MSKYQASLRLCQRLGLKEPIFQSPMAGISTIKLASEVTNHGGLGALPLASIDFRQGVSKLIEQYEEYSTLVSGDSSVVNLNFFSHDIDDEVQPHQISDWWKLYNQAAPEVSKLSATAKSEIKFSKGTASFKEIEASYPKALDELMEYLIKIKPKVVSFHFGIPTTKTIARFVEADILVFATATSVEEAKLLIDSGVTGIVCQGYEAGGHRGNFLHSNLLDENLSTHSLFLSVQKYVEENFLSNPPFLIPAGGIMDAKTIDFYLSLGASGVQLGTIFLTAPESSSGPFIKNHLSDQDRLSTIMTSLVSGKRARTIKTPFIESIIEIGNSENYDLPPYSNRYGAYKKLKGSVDNTDLGFYLAGQNYRLIDPSLKTGEIITKLAKELKRLRDL